MPRDGRSGCASRRQDLVEGAEFERFRHAGPAGGREEGAHAVVHQLPGREDHALRIGRVPGLELAEQLLSRQDRKSTRLNSSHGYISYAVFCLKKKTTTGRARWAWASTVHVC